MLKLKIILAVFLSFVITDCAFTKAYSPNKTNADYFWNIVTAKAEFSQSYGFPVFVIKEKIYAFHQEGIWTSTDGVNWVKAELPAIRSEANETRYIQFNNAVYALGQNKGNYLEGIQFGSTIRRTTDFKKWETVAEKSDLPDRVFYGSIVFGGKIWLMGGYDGKNYHNDIWNSVDGIRWNKVADSAAWSPRNVGIVEFNNRLWIFGGGVIDGDREINPNSNKEVWSSEDAIKWKKVEMKTERRLGGTAIVFDDKLWFVGANRNDGDFDSAVLVSEDGINWQSQSAPWSPRGAVAAWVFGDKLFMTGGKYSYAEKGKINFVYSNDVWAMSRKSE